MSAPAGFKGLRFPCECVSSATGGYSDPWAEITRNRLLPDGTKEEILNVLSKELVMLFEKQRPKMERAFRRTGLAKEGWKLTDVTQSLFANTYRGARAQLEERGLLAPRRTHANGARWIFWAEAPKANGSKC